MTAPATDALTAGLARANARVPEVVEALATEARVDLTGLPPGALALMLTRAAERGGAPVLVLTADDESARRLAESLAFFLGAPADPDAPGEVLVFPTPDTTPFLDVAPDRRATMDRLSVLFHLQQALPWRFVVAPVAAVLRRVPPAEAVGRRSM